MVVLVVTDSTLVSYRCGYPTGLMVEASHGELQPSNGVNGLCSDRHDFNIVDNGHKLFVVFRSPRHGQHLSQERKA